MKRDNPFDYLEVEGDPTKQNILEKEKFHGYDPSSPLTFDYSTYEDLCNSIFADDEIVFSSRSLGHFASKKQLRNSLSIWEDLKIDLHEIDMLDKSYKNVNNGYFIITQEFLDAMKLVHPFELPVLFNKRKNGEIYGQLENIAITGPDDDPDDNMVLYTNIELLHDHNNLHYLDIIHVVYLVYN